MFTVIGDQGLKKMLRSTALSKSKVEMALFLPVLVLDSAAKRSQSAAETLQRHGTLTAS